MSTEEVHGLIYTLSNLNCLLGQLKQIMITKYYYNSNHCKKLIRQNKLLIVQSSVTMINEILCSLFSSCIYHVYIHIKYDTYNSSHVPEQVWIGSEKEGRGEKNTMHCQYLSHFLFDLYLVFPKMHIL